jgi:hypothetical protein
MKISMVVKKNGATKWLDEMSRRAKNPRPVFLHDVYPYYINYQLDRWKTGDWGNWPKENSPRYKDYKMRAYGGGSIFRRGDKTRTHVVRQGEVRPGAGTVYLIATSKLLGSLVGPKARSLWVGQPRFDGTDDHFRNITNRSMHIYTLNDYARDVDIKHRFTEFDSDFRARVEKLINNYILSGKTSTDKEDLKA